MTANYPQGDGKPTCNQCLGRGVVPVPKEDRPPATVGELTKPCVCVLAREVLANLERAWKGLSKADPILKSPLRGREKENLWITASGKTIKEHLRHVAARQGPRWYLGVVSDADLMNAWLSKDIPDNEILDADIEVMRRRNRPPSSEFAALVDVIEPPTLLVIRLGVKAARNKAMCEVFLEALLHREHLGKPTWIVDQPFAPLAEGHLSYSVQASGVLEEWPRVKLDLDQPDGVGKGGLRVFSLDKPLTAPVSKGGPNRTTNLLGSGDIDSPFKPKKFPRKKKTGVPEGDEL